MTTDQAPLRWPLAAAVAAVLVALGIGLFAGPSMPWADRTPGETSLEAGFARDMQLHHRQAVRMSLAALERSDDPAVTRLALDVATLQQAQVGTMDGWLQEWGLSPTGSTPRMAWMTGHELLPDGRMPGMATTPELVELEGLRGPDFDRRYLSMLYVHHVGGLPMAEAAVRGTERGSVLTLATGVRDGQTAELDVLAAMLRQRGGVVPVVEGHDGHG